MTEKAKCKNCTDEMIEEIKQIINVRCEAELGQVHASSMNGKVTKTVDISLIAKDIYNAGYRNCKDKVVLDRHEHQKYCAYKIIEPQIKGCLNRERKLEKQVAVKENDISKLESEIDDLKYELKQARKETAKEIFKALWNAIERLAELEDKLENGTLIELHCKAGDKVYQFDNGGKIYESEIKSIYYANNTLFYDCGYFAFDKRAIGKTVFLTKAEAEKRLKN